ncbi:MAG: MAPEG family protein [Burkholderiales bacterium]|nr:MAPEG family protein [Burkholderiales bacterium]
MIPIPVTLFFCGLFALMLIPLTGMVGFRRAQLNVHFLHGDDDRLLRLIRAQGNFTETVPVTLLAMAAAEWLRMAPWAVWVGGVALLAGRLIHAWAIIRFGWTPARGYGMLLTLFALAWFGGWALWKSIRTML